MTAMLDDILVAYGASQIAHTTGSSKVPARINVQGIRVGIPLYIYASFALNSILVIALAIEAYRLRMWVHLPVFDYSNIKCSMFAASNGGRGIAGEILRNSDYRWDGGPHNQVFSKTDVTLSEKEGLPQLTATSQGIALHVTSSNQSLDSRSALLSPHNRSRSPSSDRRLEVRSIP